jgi:selenocysteine lyase/cysteine desulfurase
MIDVAALRADTPGCARVAHFNNAGAALMPRPVIAAVQGHLAREAEIGGYEAAAEAEVEGRLAAFYTGFARLLNCGPDEVAYVENATRAWDMVFYGLKLAPGERVLVHGSEYASNVMAALHRARRDGIGVDLVPSDATGQIDLAALESLIGPRHRAVLLTHVPSQGGLVNPAEAVGAIARRHGLFYLLDACQSAGQIALDVQAIGCDALSGTGRKFLRGPRGTGFLYVRRGSLDRIEPPFVDLHAGVWEAPDRFAFVPGTLRFENWESFVAGRLGLAVAVDYALGIGLPAIEARIAALAGGLRAELAGLPGVAVHDLGARRSGIVTFSRQGEEAVALSARLRAGGINTSVSTLAWSRLDFGPRGLSSVVRASVHAYNTEDEIARLVAEVAAG